MKTNKQTITDIIDFQKRITTIAMLLVFLKLGAVCLDKEEEAGIFDQMIATILYPKDVL